MNSLPVNIVDLIVIAVLLLSALLAMFRGFVKEVLSIFGWVAALAALYFFFPQAQAIARAYIETGLFADIAAGLGIFIPTLILCSLFTHWVSEQVRRAAAVSAVDRSLGFLFGLARGAILVVAVWWATERLLMPDAQARPVWLSTAKTRPLAVAGYTWAEDLILPQLYPGRAPRKNTERPVSTPIPTHTSPGSGADSRGQTGYKSEERQGIESLIQKQDKP